MPVLYFSGKLPSPCALMLIHHPFFLFLDCVNDCAVCRYSDTNAMLFSFPHFVFLVYGTSNRPGTARQIRMDLWRAHLLHQSKLFYPLPPWSICQG